MPNKAGAWENAEFLMDLSLALFQVASNSGALGPPARGSIETYLKARGHDQSWESVRQHIQKLRKARDISALEGSGDGSKPSTPSKATPRKTPASGRKRKAEVDSDADELGSPIKDEPAASAKASPSKRVKDEPSFDQGHWKNAAFYSD